MSELEEQSPPKSGTGGKIVRGALQLAGAVPVVGGVFAVIASSWSENEQERVNTFFHNWVKMLQDEIKEKEITLIEILARLDLQDEKIANRVESKEYQSLVKKTFREWSGAESHEKRKLIRNILSNAAASNISSDDVVRIFIDWINQYSELHFQVIGAIYNAEGISRGAIWKKLNKPPVREDSADADIYKLLIRDLSTGGIIRQQREKNYDGSFRKKPLSKQKGTVGNPMTSAFDEEDLYELTALGQQFIHYAMTELTSRIEYKEPLL